MSEAGSGERELEKMALPDSPLPLKTASAIQLLGARISIVFAIHIPWWVVGYSLCHSTIELNMRMQFPFRFAGRPVAWLCACAVPAAAWVTGGQARQVQQQADAQPWVASHALQRESWVLPSHQADLLGADHAALVSG